MTPQSEFLILAPVAREQVAPLRTLLATLNAEPGHADPASPLFPFGVFPTLHLARFVVLEDETLGDLEAWGASFTGAPLYLAFAADCDGDGEVLLAEMAQRCAEGLTRIFGFCEGFDGADLLGWMKARRVKPQAWYANWVGRTVGQVREEAELHRALSAELARARAEGEAAPAALHQRLRTHVRDNGPVLTPPARTPWPWRVRNAADLVAGVLILLAAAPVLLLASPILIPLLRLHETRDPEIATPYDPRRQARISQAEDLDVTNPFSAIGAVKPGPFRYALVRSVLWLLNFGCRHIYTRGRLARVGTIHFARWVVIDQGRRVLFLSNYDGSLESYMDDFINKAAFGLNLVFSNGAGYPTTSWLLLRGAQREEQFKAFLRRRQQFTDVWYKAYPGLTAFDLQRNSEIRAGLEKSEMPDRELRDWLAKI